MLIKNIKQIQLNRILIPETRHLVKSYSIIYNTDVLGRFQNYQLIFK